MEARVAYGLISPTFIIKLASETNHIYTDRSKMTNRVSVGIYCSELIVRRYFKLPKYYCIFQVKVFAVRTAAEIAKNAGSNIRKITI